MKGAHETAPLTKGDEEGAGPLAASTLVSRFAAPLAISFYVAVAVIKTMLTKALFNANAQPVAFSSVSAMATCVTLVPVFLCDRSQWATPKSEYIRGFALVCVLVALDLALTNIAVSLLAIAIQQCIVATNPAFTITIESFVRRKLQHSLLYLTVLILCVGPVVANIGVHVDSSSMWGILAQLAGVVCSAFKYVFAHAVMQLCKKDLGTFAFLFWTDVFILPILVPWAILKGEMVELLTTPDSIVDWANLLVTAVLGGVRFFSQLLVLRVSTATTLSCSNLAYQACNIYLSLWIFGKPPLTASLVAGSLITLSAAGTYTYFKVTKVLDTEPRLVAVDQRIKALFCRCCRASQ
jgi:drug/metabolite transporter (DMT)-like permease